MTSQKNWIAPLDLKVILEVTGWEVCPSHFFTVISTPLCHSREGGNPVNRICYLSEFRDHFTLLAIRAWCDALPPLRRLEKSHRTRRGNPVGSVNPILG